MSIFENVDNLSDKIFSKKKTVSRRKPVRPTKRSKNSKSRVLTDQETVKLLSREKKYVHRLSKKNLEKVKASELKRKTSQKLDVKSLNIIEDDVYFNDEDYNNYILYSSKPEEEVKFVKDENKPCGSGYVCDEWSGASYWVEFYKTKPDFRPYLMGNWVFDEWDRGYYFNH
ncbi:hypothetical protein QKC54_gp0025 [Megavirus baoshan]|uniref:Uncharacterized protein n=1 Tax=Megavirus baoshan TaxID=2496520 RepID=A0A3S5HLE2_9VIRU|nr:hypothetical protein QKC54_gp1056 [Megavirus baoshan]YP_010789306.1 hypothetical protein QKC54_gp0025 [Megavirus baoshan]AZL89707.1 hypothetical protein Mb1047 [Megavirus baoshan]UFX99707.1 hypothetical protein Mb0016 [Megavirus baoshan]